VRKAPETIGALPAEQTAYHERLPGREREGLPGPLALGVADEAEEVDRMAGRRMIEPEPSGCGRGQVGEVPLAGETDEAVRWDPSLGHGARIGSDRVA
jgi:hypothetical protein